MNRPRKFVTVGILAIVLVTGATWALHGGTVKRIFMGSNTSTGSEIGHSRAETIASGLTVPWEIVVLPDGELLVTERSGTLRRIGRDGGSIPVQGVRHVGEGGLLGLALDPEFAENRRLYLYLTTETEQGLRNRVERYRIDTERLTDREVILDGIPGARNHDGGRLAFGPDGYLYITTGDASKEQLAQDTSSLAGKILRVNRDGTVPADNPFGNEVYSYGHRNPQGLAWDSQGRLWATEHGRSGFDELNLIEKGANYGWPLIEGAEARDGMRAPIRHSGADDTWAPASLAYADGSLYFGGLRGQTLYQARFMGENPPELRAHFRQQYGRLRAVTAGPDNDLYFGTSNTDGRGKPGERDDRILRVNLQSLN